MVESRVSSERATGRLAVALVALVATGLALASACTSGRGRRAPLPAEVRVGIASNYPPLAFRREGRLAGIEVDFAERLAKDLGIKVTLVETPWERLIPALRAREIDVIMSGMSVTQDRKRLVSFTHSYLRVGQMALIRRADDKRLRDPAAMDQPTSRVGFVSASTGEAFARAQLRRAELRGFPSTDDGVAALRAGTIDYFINDAPAVWRVAGGFLSPERELRGLYTPLTQEHLAWAVRQDDEALRERLNATLRAWEEDGTLDDVLDDWIRVRVQARPLKQAP